MRQLQVTAQNRFQLLGGIHCRKVALVLLRPLASQSKEIVGLIELAAASLM